MQRNEGIVSQCALAQQQQQSCMIQNNDADILPHQRFGRQRIAVAVIPAGAHIWHRGVRVDGGGVVCKPCSGPLLSHL
jgi:hypothetical protein